MEEYNKQCNLVRRKVEKAIEKGVSIVICGPALSGKSYIQDKMRKILNKNNYNICYGIYDFKDINRCHGRTYTDEKYWIEDLFSLCSQSPIQITLVFLCGFKSSKVYIIFPLSIA